ncbi:hypothetical protein RND81_13G048600 [Saponaria officinalis]|uniref:Bifunctional inhibitor/plant lipid transfer protein/seed storage helical domain-containing protein n=1 Tax=Saponaria officinalis TaxID=3572 RepID=A0AAW1H0J0_SAPOF
MASNAIFLLCLNLAFFTMVSSSYVPTTPSPPPPSTPDYHPGGSPTPVPSTRGKCPKDTLKIAACANVLNGLVHAMLGPQRAECCSLIDGLASLDAALCLCTTLQVRVPGIVHLKVPINVNLLLNSCKKAGVPNFQCPNY